jgi:hypothetical protein
VGVWDRLAGWMDRRRLSGCACQCWLPTATAPVPLGAASLQGQSDSWDAPALARQRHAAGSGIPGLFAGRRIHVVAAPGAGGGSGAGSSMKLSQTQQMVVGEGGTLARSLGQPDGGGGGSARGATGPSPSPEGGTLLVLLTSSHSGTSGALKFVQASVGRVAVGM